MGRFLDIMRVALWFGLTVGLAEALLMAVARYKMGRYTHLPADLIWISPVANSVLFISAALLLSGLGLVWSRAGSRRVAVFAFSFLAGVDVLFLQHKVHQLAVLLLAAGAATQIERLLHRYQPLFDRLVRYALAPLVLIVVFGGAAFHVVGRSHERSELAQLPPAVRGAPNVLFIIWDTVRAANLSLFGYSRETTPVLKRLAGESVVFDRALSSAPWTLPSHGSMFTGVLPHAIEADWTVPLDKKTRTIAEFLEAHGYNTAGFVGNTYYCSDESGLDRGFVHYEDFRRASFSQLMVGSAIVRGVFGHETLRHYLHWHEEPGRKSAERINADVLHWLEAHHDRPFFAFLNYFDAHAPYLPPAPYLTKFGPRRPGRNPIISEMRPLSAAELRTEEDAYDGAIAYLDHSLGVLLDSLDARGVLQNTIVVLAADHGEQFGEHGLVSHGNSLYMPLLHVPLLIRAPGRVPAATRVSDWVTLMDLPATIAQLSTGDSAAFPGHSLARFWSGKPSDRPDTLIAEVSRVPGLPRQYPVSAGDMSTAVAASHQLILNTARADELYDVSADPAQQHNLIGSPRAAAWDAQFRAVLRQAGAWER